MILVVGYCILLSSNKGAATLVGKIKNTQTISLTSYKNKLMISMGWVAGNSFVGWAVPFIAGIHSCVSFGGALQSASGSHWNGILTIKDTYSILEAYWGGVDQKPKTISKLYAL